MKRYIARLTVEERKTWNEVADRPKGGSREARGACCCGGRSWQARGWTASSSDGNALSFENDQRMEKETISYN